MESTARLVMARARERRQMCAAQDVVDVDLGTEAARGEASLRPDSSEQRKRNRAGRVARGWPNVQPTASTS